MSGIDRLLQILELFTEQKSVWTADEMSEVLASSRATTYRYIKALGSSGLIAPAAEGAYMLGPRIIEMDRQIRISDPLLIVGSTVMAELRERVLGSILLCSFYGDKVLCIHQESTDPRVKSSYERGRPMPMLRGATSKIILACLPTYHLKSFMLHRSADVATAGLGDNWKQFRDNLKAIRQDGYFLAEGEVDPGRVGLAAPIFQGAGVIGSISVVMLKEVWSQADQKELIELITSAGKDASARLNGGVGEGRDPRSRTIPSPRKLVNSK